MIRFIINWAPYHPGSDRGTMQRKALEVFQRHAPSWCELRLCTLPGEPVPIRPACGVTVLRRDSKSIGTERALPYMKDVLDVAMEGLSPRDFGGLLNSDIFVIPGLFYELEELDSSVQVLTIHRTELKRMGDSPSTGMQWGRRKSLDGILMRAEVWEGYKASCPDFILSEPFWDTGMITWAEKQHLAVSWTHEVLHIKHAQSWKFGTPGAKYNRRLKEAL